MHSFHPETIVWTNDSLKCFIMPFDIMWQNKTEAKNSWYLSQLGFFFNFNELMIWMKLWTFDCNNLLLHFDPNAFIIFSYIFKFSFNYSISIHCLHFHTDKAHNETFIYDSLFRQIIIHCSFIKCRTIPYWLRFLFAFHHKIALGSLDTGHFDSMEYRYLVIRLK